jgi:hypothetical protein
MSDLPSAATFVAGGVPAVPSDPDALLTRQQTAAALTAAGFPIAVSTLSTMATRGGGPEYRKFGPKVLYLWGPTLQWALARLSPPRCSTSEAPRDRAA